MEIDGKYRPLTRLADSTYYIPFPLDGFPVWARDYICEAAKSFQVDTGMVGLAVLSCLATALQAKYDVRPKEDHIEPLILQVIIIAPSGSRKSVVIKSAFAPAYDYEAALVNKLRHDDNYNPKKTRVAGETAVPTIIIDDCTPEAMVIRLEQNHGRISVVSAEGNVFNLLSGRYNKTMDYSVLAKGYSMDPIRYDRVGRAPNIVQRPHISCCIGIQPSVFKTLAENSALNDQGILARWCMAQFHNPTTPREYGNTTITDKTKQAYYNHIESLFCLEMNSQPQHLTLSDVAYVHYCNIYKTIEGTRIALEAEETDSPIVRWINKQAGTILRIAGILHIANDQSTTVITASELDAAIAITDWLLQHANNLLSSASQAVADATILWQQIVTINRGGNNRVPYSKVTHDCCRTKRFKLPGSDKPNYNAIDSALEVLIQHGYIQMETIQTSGRPGKMVIISPDALTADLQT